MDNDVVQRSGDDYGAVYLPSPRAQSNWETIEEILEGIE